MDEYDRADDLVMLEFLANECATDIRGMPKWRDMLSYVLERVRAKQVIRIAIVAGRGNGKTRFVAGLITLLWRLYGFDAQVVGGSLKQAKQCYSYTGEAYDLSELVRRHTRKRTMSETVSIDEGVIGISAASQTSVRGPHPAGPEGGGLLALDEVALIPDDIINAAMGQLSSAKPSVCVMFSTLGERQTGRFAEVLESPEESGYKVFRFDSFDAVSRCEYDCETTCPVKDHFWGNHVDDEDPGHYVDMGGNRRQWVHAPYCGGRAKEVDGHLEIDEIAQQWRDTDRETFEREHLGIGASKIGKVWDGALLQRAQGKSIMLGKDQAQHDRRFKVMDKAIGHDWGWAGMSCAAYGVRLQDVIIVYAWEMWDHTQFRKISEHLLDRAWEDRIEYIQPDAAEPSENDAMREDAERRAAEEQRAEDKKAEKDPSYVATEVLEPFVAPVVFSKWKTYAYGEARRRLEREKIIFASHFGGRPVPNYKRAMEMLAGHEKKEDGSPKKKDDHVSDALVCLLLKWSKRWSASPTVG